MVALSPAIFSFTWGGRVVTGLGVCLVTPSVLGLVAALYQGRQRAIAFGTIAGAAALSTLSALILGIVMDSSGFRLTFAIMAAYFVVVLCCARLIPRTPASGGHTHFDVAGTVVAALGMRFALFGVGTPHHRIGASWPRSSAPSPCAGCPPPCPPSSWVWCSSDCSFPPSGAPSNVAATPLIPAAFVTSPSVRAGLSAVALPFFYMGAVGILATPYLQLVTGFTALQTGMLSLLSGIPMFLLATFLPKLAPFLSIAAHHPRALSPSRLRVQDSWLFGVHAHGVSGSPVAGMALMASGWAPSTPRPTTPSPAR